MKITEVNHQINKKEIYLINRLKDHFFKHKIILKIFRQHNNKMT